MKKTKKYTRSSKFLRPKKKFSFAGNRKKFVRKHFIRLPISLDRLRRERQITSRLTRFTKSARRRTRISLRTAAARLRKSSASQRSHALVRHQLNRVLYFTNTYANAALPRTVTALRRKYRLQVGLFSAQRQTSVQRRLPLFPLTRATSMVLRTAASLRKYLATRARFQKVCLALRKIRVVKRRLRRRRKPRYRRWPVRKFRKYQKGLKKVLAKISKAKRKPKKRRRQLRIQRFSAKRVSLRGLIKLRTRSIRKRRRVMRSWQIKR